MRNSVIKAKLAKNQPVLLTTLHFGDPTVFEMTSLMGWDGIWLDLEHHGHSVETAAHFARAARVGASDIMIRPAKGEFMRMGRILEIGATGIMYPRCDNAEEAKQVVRWSKFAPLGERGIDSGNCDNPYCLMPLADYIKAANEQTFIVIQIEDPKALVHAEAMAAVEGVDILFLGPGDFSILAGIPGQFDHPKIKDAMKQVAAAAKKAGKHWGMPIFSVEHAKEVLELGGRFLCHGADLLMVKNGLEDIAKKLRPLGVTFDRRVQFMAKHHILIIGVGSIGERHVRCFQGTGRCQVSIVEINPTLRQSVAERYGVPAHAALEEALASKPTAAVVAVPAHLHLPIARQLAEAGVHLLIEKPLSTSLQGVRELSKLVSKKKLVCGVAYVYRSHPILRAMREAIASGRFGQPVELVAACGQHFPTYRPAYREIYYKDRATGGGAIQDALTHILNAGQWLAGPITKLVADAEHQVLPGVEVEDTVHILARHARVQASYALNQHQAPNEVSITVVCERGTVRFEAHESRFRWLTTPGEPWHEVRFPQLERDTLFSEQATLFLDALEGKRPVTCSLDEGEATLRANLAALASCASGQWISLDDESL